jgi:hypothetical protein
MAQPTKISCINKSDRFNPHERIVNIGGIDPYRWKISQQEGVRNIENGIASYYVEKNGNRVKVIVAISQYGNKYLKTEADDDQPNNLLSLPECP